MKNIKTSALPSYRLPRRSKLKSRHILQALFQQKQKGKNFYPLRVVWYAQSNEAAQVQIVVSVSKKLYPLATARNRFKRQLREAYRLQQHLLQDALADKKSHLLALMLLYIGKEEAPFSLIYRQTNAALQHICQQLNYQLPNATSS